MPPYVALMKGLLSKKKVLKGDETVVLTKEYSGLIQSMLPKKMLDPGASKFLLQIQEAQPTRIALEMADKSLKQAHRLLENVIVKVGELFLSADFVILDIGEDANDFLILGMPFLATGRNLIDVERGELVLRLREDYLVFK
ncbi:uncharacterized protein LOC107472055, partial [Arachis duranensis]|uniref:Uncharacterized protein LOC107472055 n=1 Tax=Arachis duranensis TaxID=130453 RepID=A0A6P4C816_ARADU